MLITFHRIALTVCAVGVVASIAAATATPIEARRGVGAATVTVDFSAYGSGRYFDPLFFRSDGLVFPPQWCGPAGCQDWFVGYVQGDEALIGGVAYGGVRGAFTRPVSDLTLQVAQGYPGTAVYTLTAFGGGGKAIARRSLTVVQGEGLAQPGAQSYSAIGLTDLARPAKSFALEGHRASGSSGESPFLEFGVSTITYTHWGEAAVGNWFALDWTASARTEARVDLPTSALAHQPS